MIRIKDLNLSAYHFKTCGYHTELEQWVYSDAVFKNGNGLILGLCNEKTAFWAVWILKDDLEHGVVVDFDFHQQPPPVDKILKNRW